MRIEDLYSPEILALATSIPHLGRLEGAHGEASLRSRACGSRITVRLRLDAAGRVSAFAQEVEACALAQAAAAILGRGIMGATSAEVRQAREILSGMLKTGAAPPQAGRWAELRMLAPVRDVPARHESVLLPFEAACRALAMAETAVKQTR
jgi:NifU-like protein involved in Fe-S cluster formation